MFKMQKATSSEREQGMWLTTHLHLVPRLRMSATVPPLSHMP